MYTTTRGSSGHTSHMFCSFFYVCGLKRDLLLLFVWWVWSFFSLLHLFSLAVFKEASAFNQDVSEWNTGAVTRMRESKCTLSLSTTTRGSSNHKSHKFCSFFCLRFETGPFVVVCSLFCTLSCSVFFRICVQSGRV